MWKLQRADGSWEAGFTGVIPETSLALLFLRKANLAPDLSVRLRNRVRDQVFHAQ